MSALVEPRAAPGPDSGVTPAAWPDWRGRACAIIASGPSAKTANVEQLKGKTAVIAIKENHELAPFADVVYGCDWPWWRQVHGLPAFPGLRMAWDRRALDRFPGIVRVDIEIGTPRLLFGRTGLVGGGGNSAFHALNLAVQFGARRILMVGLDLHDRSGVHWYGRATAQGRANPDANNFRNWIGVFGAAAPVLAEMGCEVINASPISDLRCWPRRSIADTLKDWGLA